MDSSCREAFIPVRSELGLSEWRDGGDLFVFRSWRVFYRSEGRGPVLVLLHGFPTASWDWHAVWPHLVADHRIVAPDFLGFGYSSKPARHHYSLFEQADLVEALLQELGVARYHALAHDYGDTVAQELLARTVERIESGAVTNAPRLESVCFMNGGIFPEAVRPLPVQRLLRGPAGRFLGPVIPYRLFHRILGRLSGQGLPPETTRALWELVTRDGGRRTVHDVLQYLRERQRYRDRWVGALRRVDVPLQLVIGPADPVSGRTMAKRWREVLPGAGLTILGEGVGHYPQLEDPEGVVEACATVLSPGPGS